MSGPVTGIHRTQGVVINPLFNATTGNIRLIERRAPRSAAAIGSRVATPPPPRIGSTGSPGGPSITRGQELILKALNPNNQNREEVVSKLVGGAIKRIKDKTSNTNANKQNEAIQNIHRLYNTSINVPGSTNSGRLNNRSSLRTGEYSIQGGRNEEARRRNENNGYTRKIAEDMTKSILARVVQEGQTLPTKSTNVNTNRQNAAIEGMGDMFREPPPPIPPKPSIQQKAASNRVNQLFKNYKPLNTLLAEKSNNLTKNSLRSRIGNLTRLRNRLTEDIRNGYIQKPQANALKARILQKMLNHGKKLRELEPVTGLNFTPGRTNYTQIGGLLKENSRSLTRNALNNRVKKMKNIINKLERDESYLNESGRKSAINALKKKIMQHEARAYTLNKPGVASSPNVPSRINFRKVDDISKDLAKVFMIYDSRVDPSRFNYSFFEQLDGKYGPPPLATFGNLKAKFRRDPSGYIAHAVAQIVTAAKKEGIVPLVIQRTEQLRRQAKMMSRGNP
jgi:hypothetical protein